MAAPLKNTNAETWTLEQATDLFNKCLETSQDKSLDCNDFLGEVAQENNTTLWQLDYLKEKFPQLEKIYKMTKSNCEANCFANGKKGNIVPSLAIMNLKSNHGWTDRTDNTNINIDAGKLTDEEIKRINDKLERNY